LKKMLVKRVLVYEYLSAGGWRGGGGDAAVDELLPSGLSMRDAMLADLMQIPDCSVSVACDPAVKRGRDEASGGGSGASPALQRGIQPHAGESAFAFVARQSALHDLVWLVAPETGGLLARFQRSVGDARWLGCDAGAIELTTRKHATLAHLASHGVPTPLAFADAPGIRRWVVKPDDGAGGVDTHVHARRDAALAERDQRAQTGEAVTLEPWIEGDALSLSLLCKARDTEMLSVNRQHIAVDAQGRLAFQGVSVNVLASGDSRRPSLATLATHVARAIPGLRGFVGIDLVWHPQHGPVVIEINPRLTCAYVGLSAALRRNLADELIADRLRGNVRDEEPAHA
jgi:predicted ATP-grasp superfamily ATP-dependent carboligase